MEVVEALLMIWSIERGSVILIERPHAAVASMKKIGNDVVRCANSIMGDDLEVESTLLLYFVIFLL